MRAPPNRNYNYRNLALGAAGTLGMHAARQGINRAIRSIGYRKPSYYRSTLRTTGRNNYYNAGVPTNISRLFNRTISYDTNAFNKDVLQSLSFLEIPQGVEEGQRLTDQAYVKEVFCEFNIENISGPGTYFRWAVLSYADPFSGSGDKLFADIVTNTSTALDFATATPAVLKYGPFHKSTVGVKRFGKIVISGYAANWHGNKNQMVIKFRVPINQIVQFEGANEMPNYRLVFWHTPQASADNPVIRINAVTTTKFHNVN